MIEIYKDFHCKNDFYEKNNDDSNDVNIMIILIIVVLVMLLIMKIMLLIPILIDVKNERGYKTYVVKHYI